MNSTLKSELKKIWYPRISKIYLILTVVLSIGVGLLLSVSTPLTQGRPFSELSPMEVISANMLGVDIATFFLIIFVSMKIGREYQTKIIEAYVIAIPNRRKYFVSNIGCFMLIAFFVGLIVSAFTMINSYLLLQVINEQFPPFPDVFRFATGSLLMPIVYSIFAVCGSFMFRNTAGGIGLSVGVMFYPMLVPLFPDAVQKMILPALPASAIHSLAGVTETGSLEHVGTIAAIFVLILWSVFACFVAMRKFRHRDI